MDRMVLELVGARFAAGRMPIEHGDRMVLE